MRKIILWVKSHKLATVLLLIICWFLFRNYFIYNLLGTSFKSMPVYDSYDSYSDYGAPAAGLSKVSLETSMPNMGMPYESTPRTTTENRMVVRNSHMSLKVRDVPDSLSKITKYVDSVGGYMVDSSVNNPQDAASGTITVRIPETTFDESLDFFRSLSVKVVSENLTGRDVTDQYQDIEERLRILEGNKLRFEEIMQEAVDIDDIVSIQEKIFSIQNQIDSLKGQQQMLSQTAKLSKVTIYLGTDELSLPYAPEHAWRPKVVFQRAVRSLLTNLQNIGSLLIWLFVYSVIWVPVLLAFIFYRRRKRNRSQNLPKQPQI